MGIAKHPVAKLIKDLQSAEPLLLVDVCAASVDCIHIHNPTSFPLGEVEEATIVVVRSLEGTKRAKFATFDSEILLQRLAKGIVEREWIVDDSRSVCKPLR